MQGWDPVSPSEPRVTSPFSISIHLLTSILKIHIFCTEWHLEPSVQFASDILILYLATIKLGKTSCLCPLIILALYEKDKLMA